MNLVTIIHPLSFQSIRTLSLLLTIAAASVVVLSPLVVSALHALSAPSSPTLVNRSACPALQANLPSTVERAEYAQLAPFHINVLHNASPAHLVSSQAELGKHNATSPPPGGTLTTKSVALTRYNAGLAAFRTLQDKRVATHAAPGPFHPPVLPSVKRVCLANTSFIQAPGRVFAADRASSL